MFYFKKTEEKLPNVDLTKEHSTSELHVMNAVPGTDTCTSCSKKFKDGDKVQISSVSGKMRVDHWKCLK